SKYLGKLLSLKLDKCNIDKADAALIASLASLSTLTTLSLADNTYIGSEGVQAIVNSPYLTHLTELNLAKTMMGAEGAKAVAASPYLTNLQLLNLSENYLINGLEDIFASDHLPKLTMLDLAGLRWVWNETPIATFQKIAASGKLTT